MAQVRLVQKPNRRLTAWPCVPAALGGSRAGISPLPNLFATPVHPRALVGSEMQFLAGARRQMMLEGRGGGKKRERKSRFLN